MASLLNNRLLIYAQDQGGARFIKPVIKKLVQEQSPDILFLVHPLSEPLFRQSKLPYMSLNNSIGTPPISVDSWTAFLQSEHIERVFCTTSSPYLDLSNSHLILSAKQLCIPVMAVLDHWKGFGRFFNKNSLDFLPDHLCCIDKSTCQRLSEVIKGEVVRIYPVGHPHLEGICRQCWGEISKECIRILLISQPKTLDRSFKGIFFAEIDGYRLIDRISGFISAIALGTEKRVEVRIRTHPKERFVESLPDGMEFDRYQDWTQSLKESNIFIGFDSMALVEASLAGKFCIKLAFPEFRIISDNSVPLSLGVEAGDFAELARALENGVAATENPRANNHKRCEEFLGSTSRTLAVLKRFLEMPDQNCRRYDV